MVHQAQLTVLWSLNNIGSAIKNQIGADYLTKLDTANGLTPNAAVNVSDLHNTAEALRSSELHIAPTTVKAGSTEAKGGTAMLQVLKTYTNMMQLIKLLRWHTTMVRVLQ